MVHYLSGMSLFDWSILAIAVLLTGASLAPRVRNNRWWGAMVTPLASIIGSGFLVIAPLLASVAGSYALEAMLLIVVLAFFIGAVIRFNIRYSEPLEASGRGPRGLPLVARLSGMALTLAYVISVAFYIRLLASFALSMAPFDSGFYENWLATVILGAIALIGWFRGLRGLEVIETVSVSIKLSIIIALLAALFWFNLGTGQWRAELAPADTGSWTRLQMLAGMLLVVQGFETSRYLGAAYPAGMRRSTMFWAQVSSGVIYVLFVALVVPLLAFLPEGRPDETAIITISGNVARVLPLLLIFAALMSQLSAGIADTVGAGGLVSEETG
ncbi:MAG: amino acid permease, partial [Halocynthiibacter sp.]